MCMLKISPIKNFSNTKMFVNNSKNIVKNNNKTNLLSSSLLALSILGMISVNGCSKIEKPVLETKSRQIDSTEVVDNKPEIVVDTTTNVIEHYITL